MPMKKWKRPAAACLAAVLAVTMLPYAGGTVVTHAAAENLAVNGGFESGDRTGWTENSWCVEGGAISNVVQSDSSVNPAEGSYFLKHEGRTNGAQVLQSVTLQAGHTYWLSAQLYQETVNSLSVGFMENEGKDGDPIFQTSNETGTGQWVKKAVRFTMWSGAEKSQLYTWLNKGTVGYVDDIRLTEAADYSDLETTVSDAENRVSMTDYYTEASIEALQSVLTEAKAMADVYDPDNVADTQDDVDAMTVKL